jgi:hypothetical protein
VQPGGAMDQTTPGHRWTQLLAAVALAGWVAACGQGGGGGGARGPAGGAAAGGVSPGGGGGAGALPEACTLLAQADVRAVTREAAGLLSSTLDDAVGKDPSQCSYGLSSDLQPRAISLVVRRWPSPEQAADQLRAAESGLRSLSLGAPVEDVAGLGDGAFWVGGRIDQLHVRRGDAVLIFTVQIDQEPLRAARELAGKALARLAAPRALGPQPPAARPPTARPAAPHAGISTLTPLISPAGRRGLWTRA